MPRHLPLILRRKTSRWVHIVAGSINVVYVYTPLHEWSHGLTMVQCVTMPLLILTGYRLWQRRPLTWGGAMQPRRTVSQAMLLNA